MAEGFVCRFRAICCECSAVGFKVEVSKLLDATFRSETCFLKGPNLTSLLRRVAYKRVFAGATLSTIDLWTDIYITYTFWRDGKDLFFKCSIAMLASSILIMSLMIILQNMKRGLQKVLIEVLSIPLGLKPAFDAYRVASNAKRQEGQLFDPLAEMIHMKGAEIFAEAIPGVIIQLSAIVASTTESTSRAAFVSVAISALTAGFTSATISFDMDTDQTSRKDNPEFYGYMPDSAKKRTGEK